LSSHSASLLLALLFLGVFFFELLNETADFLGVRGRKLSASHRAAIKTGIARAKRAQGKAA
jgi:hypothetical protein